MPTIDINGGGKISRSGSMNKEYERQIEVFCSSGDDDCISFFHKFWLYQKDYEKIWKPLERTLFREKPSGLPEPVFSDSTKFVLIPLRGGVVFDRRDFDSLRAFLRETGEEFFVVVENYDPSSPFTNYLPDGATVEHPPLRFKFRANLSWSELAGGGGVSQELVAPHKDYFVYGDRGVWAKYAANDYEDPLDIFMISGEYEFAFRKAFARQLKDAEDISTWVPHAFRKDPRLRLPK